MSPYVFLFRCNNNITKVGIMKAADYMRLALKEAQKDPMEVPVGALVVKDGLVIAAAHNLCEAQRRQTAHAEMLALDAATEALGDWRLDGCTLYCTLEPCAMCAGAIVNSRVSRVVFGAFDSRAGAMGSVLDVPYTLGGKTLTLGGVLEDECAALLKEAFVTSRERKEQADNEQSAARV